MEDAPWTAPPRYPRLFLRSRRRLKTTSKCTRRPDLLADVGIYGNRAVGEQKLDENCRTLKFTLDLDPGAVSGAEDRWRRLALYAVPFESLLDHADPHR
jgi:hypothetical protein